MLRGQAELTSSPVGISQVEKLVDNLKRDMQLRDEVYGDILVALIEIVNNAIRHGNKKDITKKVLLAYTISSKEAIFTVKDEGTGFDTNNLPDPTLPETINQLRGRGIHIAKHMASHLEFKDRGSTVVLYFNL